MNKPRITRNKVGLWVCQRWGWCVRCDSTPKEAYTRWLGAEEEWEALAKRKLAWDTHLLSRVASFIYEQ